MQSLLVSYQDTDECHHTPDSHILFPATPFHSVIPLFLNEIPLFSHSFFHSFSTRLTRIPVLSCGQVTGTVTGSGLCGEKPDSATFETISAFRNFTLLGGIPLFSCGQVTIPVHSTLFSGTPLFFSGMRFHFFSGIPLFTLKRIVSL